MTVTAKRLFTPALRSAATMTVKRLFTLALFAAALPFAPLAPGAETWEAGTDGLLPIPPLAGRVNDLTHTLSSAEVAALSAKLAGWESGTSNQLVVLMVPTTQPEPIEAYSIRVVEKWKIGRKGQDNGALLLIAKNDRKMRIEVGYGLEGVLTDVTSRRIIAEKIAPAFREGRFYDGIDAGVDRIIAVVGQGNPLPPAKSDAAAGAGGTSLESWLVFLFIAVPVVGGILRTIFGRVLGSTIGGGIVATAAWVIAGSVAIAVFAGVVGFVVMILLGSGLGAVARGGRWTGTPGGWGGGGFGGGGGGGFSGGGGSFGGGGASGNW